MTQQKGNPLDMIWAMALIAAGIGVFFRIPQIMPDILAVEYFAGSAFFIRLSFYCMALILVGGGLKKIWNRFWKA
ncbi:hypothetical protein OOT00_06945 [Desulfobotulus sp. H1]|uniref:Uncharacterized protein n=1 Tax=Desulfobotulus pelophilus TaxID=2823377 RepID=A0ABT3N8E1_9BACT|nr:hypothetical protein [Desulfobotulus pelophilus]MCW7753719.1 hypothetical protein [Desulfobotulus pelophilus]